MKNKLFHILTGTLAATTLVVAAMPVFAELDGSADQTYCMDVVIEPFHMVPDGSCAVRDYWGGSLQQELYPFTVEEHLFNCEYFGPLTPLPTGEMVPSSVVSDGSIVGTIGGHPFAADLLCASLTNWYQDSCTNPDDPMSCTFQLAQPFLSMGLPFPRITEVSILDGVISVQRHGESVDVPVLMATRAAGVMHLEDLTTNPPLVGGSITHSSLGLLVYEADDEEGDDEDFDAKMLAASADLLLQGHIFAPVAVEDDPGAAVIKGSVCSKELYGMLNRRGGGGHDDD